MKVYQGPGMIADKAQAPILPIRIDGALYTPFTRLKGKVKTKLFPKITISILPKREFKLDKNLSARQKRQKASQVLYELMTDMMFESSQSAKPLVEALIDAKKTHGGRTKIIEDIKRHPLSYAQILKKMFVLSQYFKKDTQTKNKEKIALFLPNTNALIVSFFAVNAARKIPVMLNFSAGIKNLLSALKTSKTEVILTSKAFIKQAELTEVIQTLKKHDVSIIYLEDLANQISFRQKLSGLLQYYYPSIYFTLQDSNSISC
jgi:acyl-[acyl-carrier-protein]-phospholipid O-acyltransferase/long-chain-fatty-acid--[acyl-carrier-protein] ligase